MKLTYQTGIGTMVQFILLSFVTLASQVVTVISTCRKEGDNCLSNLSISVIFYILVAVVFGSIWIIGLGAQHRRSKRLAQLLICIEGVVALVALFSVKLSLHGERNIFGLVVSFGIFLLAIWIISLAFRLMKASGGRVSSLGGQRRRRRPASS